MKLFNRKLAFVVRPLCIMLCIVLLHNPAFANKEQKFNFNFKKAEIADILHTIEKQTNYRFLYNENLKAIKQKVSLSVQDAEIKEVLDQLFQKTSLQYILSDNHLIIIKDGVGNEMIIEADDLFADISISGKVTGTDGAALNGVSVRVKGSTKGTSTNSSGNFSITADENATLIFSYIGYAEMEMPVSGKRTINVNMVASASELDQVVVIGYGTQKKRDLTGSITSVNGDEIAKMPSTNPIASLQGKVPGLTVSNSGRAGASPVVRIRGVNSTNSASPVYVVDGILQDNIDYLNPADIESIDVLRDPSSIAIYGLRGANGVIAVTTKKAERGKSTINLQSSVGVQVVNDKIDVVDAAGFKKLYTAQLANLNAAPFDFTNYNANTNWQDLMLQDAIITSHNLSISNSGDRSNSKINIGYTNQEGVLKNDKYERFMARFNQEIRFNNNIKVGGDITGYHWISNPPAASITNALWAAPIVPVMAGPGLYYSMPSFQRAQVGNPQSNLDRNNRTSIVKGYRFIGSLFAEVKFLKNFTWRSTVYTDISQNSTRDYTPLPFRFINLGEGTAKTDTTINNTVRTAVTQEQGESRRYQQDHTLSFTKTLKGGHSINALAGFTTIYSQSSFVNATRRDTSVNIPNDPDFWYINIANANNPGNLSGGGSENSIAGVFGRVSYAYQNKYLLNATIRRDGSSKFAPANRWGTFGSVGAGWVASEENFIRNISWIDFLKFRGAWGLTGNANGFADNLWQPGISNASTAVFGDNIYTSIQAAYIPDPNLHWETVKGIDIGFDLRTLNKRLNFEFTYYDRTTTDILTAVTLPNETRSFFTNLGEISNKGIEVMATWSDKLGSKLTYSVSGNFSYNKNNVNAIGDKINFQLIGNSGANLTTTGQSIGYFYGYTQVGVYQSTADLVKQPAFGNSLPGDLAYADLNGDGVITPADRGFLGSPFPPYNFGGSLSLGYKGFDFEVELQGQAGHKIFTQRRTSNFAVLNYESMRLNAWTAPGTSNIEPILDNTRANNYLMSSYFLEPGDYLRIRTLQIGYNFEGSALKRLGIQKGRVFVSGQNMKTWSKVTGYSPEPLIGSILGGGADNGSYPVPAIYSLGLNLTF